MNCEKAMKIMRSLAISISLLLLAGCGTYNQSVQVDDKAYLLLIGNPVNCIVTIDNQKPINLSRDTVSYNLNGQQATKIEIPIGRHKVKITKNGDIIVHREFYVSTGNSFEVQL